MTAVFVHGVPETAAVWSGLLAALGRPGSEVLSLPGFDGVRPEGFGATMDEYAAWLVAQLERLDGPVDLVGHDYRTSALPWLTASLTFTVRPWTLASSGVRTSRPSPPPDWRSSPARTLS